MNEMALLHTVYPEADVLCNTISSTFEQGSASQTRGMLYRLHELTREEVACVLGHRPTRFTMTRARPIRSKAMALAVPVSTTVPRTCRIKAGRGRHCMATAPVQGGRVALLAKLATTITLEQFDPLPEGVCEHCTLVKDSNNTYTCPVYFSDLLSL